MRHLTKVFILLGLILIFGSISNVSSHTPALANDNSLPTDDRLVVFEAFMRST